MKLIIAGATGFVATELIRQALSQPKITSIVALARRTTNVPENLEQGADAAKLKSVVCEDFSNYPESVKKELAGADACVWLLAVTPSKSRSMPWQEVRKVCFDYTVTGLEALSRLPREGTTQPLRFIYTSGASSQPDPSKKPWLFGDYCLMRGEVESRVLEYAAESKGTVDACVAKPGLIFAPGRAGLMTRAMRTIGCSLIGLPVVGVREVAAALLDQAVGGFEKDKLLNEDLARIGQKALGGQPEHSRGSGDE